MQFINGINLRAQIERWGKYSAAEALPLALEIARIIEYMHDHAPPAVHRDLTPDNFILEDDGAITLIDFGAANYFLTSVTGTIIGKAAYMPLEQFKGRPELKSDVYSFAKTIYFCTTGLEPEVFEGVFEGQSKDEFSKLMADCTQDQASDRPTIREVVMRLEALC
jgi:serine/threonine protein kinase